MTQYALELPNSERVEDHKSSTFVPNLRLPVHRWLRFSAGFSAAWAESVIARLAALLVYCGRIEGSATGRQSEGTAVYLRITYP
jgi:hypothetical protein